MKFSRNLIAVIGLAAAGSAAFTFHSRLKKVTVVTPTVMRVTETIAASGRLRGETESSIGATNGGRVAKILVHEGDRVRAHQLIARMDSDVLNAQIAQAQAAVRTAQEQLEESSSSVQTAAARLRQASRPPLNSDVERLRAEIQQNNRVAQAKLASAKQHQTAMYQRFLEVKNGTRREEIQQAATQAQQAEINLKQLEREWNRQSTLYKANAVARVEAERAETNYLMGKQALENAQQRLKQLQEGNRAEQIASSEADYEAARADVVAAEADVDGVRRSGAAQMQSLLATPRPEDVAVAARQQQQAVRARDVARQRLTEAQTALMLARHRAAETRIFAPFAGTITQIVTEAGAIAGPNAPLARLVRTGQPEIRVDLDESNLGRLQIGQKALVTNDAFSEARLYATVSEIGAQVDAERGTVEVHLVPIALPDWARPGQTFTVNIVLGSAKEQMVIPARAVRVNGGIASVLAVESGRIVKKIVKATPMSAQGIPILLGVTRDTQVIVEPANLLEGESVIAARSNSTRIQKGDTP